MFFGEKYTIFLPWKLHHSLNSFPPAIVCSWSCQLHLPGPGQTVRALTGLPNNPTQATGRALSHRGSYIDYLITFGGPERPPKTTECTCISHVYLCGCIYVGRGEWYFWWARRPLLTSPSRLPLCAFSQHFSLFPSIFFTHFIYWILKLGW